MGRLRAAQAALMELLAACVPAVAARLEGEGVPVREQTTSWLLGGLLDALPLEATLRVWDLLFLEGEAAVLRAAAAAFALHEERLLRAPADEVFDLTPCLECDAATLVGASLAPAMRRRAQEVLQRHQLLPDPHGANGDEVL